MRRLLPGEDIFYVGDTARVPYGGKSAATIQRYSREISGLLLGEGARMIVVACNTASALAVPALERELAVPVLGVIGPGARAAVQATRSGRIGVIGTRATVRSGAYEEAIRSLDPAIRVWSVACPLLVPLIEEGWLEDPVTHAVIGRYLEPLLKEGVDTLVLGCTHYPLLHTAIQNFAGGQVALVDSADNCALAVRDLLLRHGGIQTAGAGRLQVAVTDATGSFLQVAEKALGLEVGEVLHRTVPPLSTTEPAGECGGNGG